MAIIPCRTQNTPINWLNAFFAAYEVAIFELFTD